MRRLQEQRGFPASPGCQDGSDAGWGVPGVGGKCGTHRPRERNPRASNASARCRDWWPRVELPRPRGRVEAWMGPGWGPHTLHHTRVGPKTPPPPIPEPRGQDNPAGHVSAGDTALSCCSPRSWLRSPPPSILLRLLLLQAIKPSGKHLPGCRESLLQGFSIAEIPAGEHVDWKHPVPTVAQTSWGWEQSGMRCTATVLDQPSSTHPPRFLRASLRRDKSDFSPPFGFPPVSTGGDLGPAVLLDPGWEGKGGSSITTQGCVWGGSHPGTGHP